MNLFFFFISGVGGEEWKSKVVKNSVEATWDDWYVLFTQFPINPRAKKSTKNLFLYISNRSEHTFIVDG
jgi:hypothetical protein